MTLSFSFSFPLLHPEMIDEHLAVLPVHRIQHHHPVQVHLLHLGLFFDQVRFTQEHHRPQPQMGIPRGRPDHLRIGSLGKYDPFRMPNQLFGQG